MGLQFKKMIAFICYIPFKDNIELEKLFAIHLFLSYNSLSGNGSIPKNFRKRWAPQILFL